MQIRRLGKGTVYRNASEISIGTKGMFSPEALVVENFYERTRKMLGQDKGMNIGGITDSAQGRAY